MNLFEKKVEALLLEAKESKLITDLLGMLEKNNPRDRNQPAERSFVRKTIEAALSGTEDDKQIVKTVAFILYKERLWEVNDAKADPTYDLKTQRIFSKLLEFRKGDQSKWFARGSGDTILTPDGENWAWIMGQRGTETWELEVIHYPQGDLKEQVFCVAIGTEELGLVILDDLFGTDYSKDIE